MALALFFKQFLDKNRTPSHGNVISSSAKENVLTWAHKSFACLIFIPLYPTIYFYCFLFAIIDIRVIVQIIKQIKSIGRTQWHCWVPQTMSHKNWRSMGVKEGNGTGKTMLSLGVAWKCQAWENWLFPSGVYSMRWESSQRSLLSSGVSEICGGATWSRVQPVPLAAFNSRLYVRNRYRP